MQLPECGKDSGSGSGSAPLRVGGQTFLCKNILHVTPIWRELGPEPGPGLCICHRLFACITSQRSGRTDKQTEQKTMERGVGKPTHKKEKAAPAARRKRIQNFSGSRSHFVIFANKRVKFQGAPQWGMPGILGDAGMGVMVPQSPAGRHVRAIFGIQLTREIAHAD